MTVICLQCCSLYHLYLLFWIDFQGMIVFQLVVHMPNCIELIDHASYCSRLLPILMLNQNIILLSSNFSKFLHSTVTYNPMGTACRKI